MPTNMDVNAIVNSQISDDVHSTPAAQSAPIEYSEGQRLFKSPTHKNRSRMKLCLSNVLWHGIVVDLKWNWTV